MDICLASRSRKSENEASKRLFRGAVETAQRLDQSFSKISNVASLFAPELLDLRMKLKEFCERLIFTDPLEMGKKAEDLLWRKVYYEFFQKCKQNKKKLLDSEYHQHILHNYLLAAIGSYHHLLLRLQTEYHLDLEGQANIPFMWQQRGLKKGRWMKYQQSVTSDEAMNIWAKQACHRTLTYLGDLARYIAELQPKQQSERQSRHISERYYMQAFCMNPKNGTPWNQMGSLAENGFDSAYYYMRCLSSVERFDAAEGNLHRLFERNNEVLKEIETSSCNISKGKTNSLNFLTKFLKVCEIFYFSSDDNLQGHCQGALQDFDSCMPSNDSVIPVDASTDKANSILKDDDLFKVIVMCMICNAKLLERESSDVWIATAFTLALYSSIVHYCTMQLSVVVEESVNEHSNIPDKEGIFHNFISDIKETVNELDVKSSANIDDKTSETNRVHSKKSSGKKSKKMRFRASNLHKLRRRRKISSTSQEDSELSDVEILDLGESDEENVLVNSMGSSSDSLSERDEEDDEFLSVKQNNLQNKNKCLDNLNNLFIETNPGYIKSLDDAPSESDETKPDSPSNAEQSVSGCSRLFEVLAGNKLLGCLKILMDWLKINRELLTHCSESLKFCFLRLADLFNLMYKIQEHIRKSQELSHLDRTGKEWKQNYPLSEDILLQNLPLLEPVHANISFKLADRKILSVNEQIYLYVQSILSFGDILTDEFKSFISFDNVKKKYCAKAFEDEENGVPKLQNNVPNNNNHSQSPEPENSNSGNNRQRLMHDMAHLWLKAEVNNLEKSMKNNHNPHFSPLLVADASSLCGHLPLLKQLVATKNFVVIVPNIVIDNLDQVKKRSVGAREAIRWLEYVFHKGNRHIRVQRDNERCSVNPIKYPRRKDKESWDFFQILECCHFLTQQQQSKCSMVTLLIGTNNNLPSNASPLVRSLNISMENIESFFTKWHTSSKKPG